MWSSMPLPILGICFDLDKRKIHIQHPIVPSYFQSVILDIFMRKTIIDIGSQTANNRSFVATRALFKKYFIHGKITNLMICRNVCLSVCVCVCPSKVLVT